MIVCAGQSEQIRGAIPIGIGLLESACTLYRLIKDENPHEILFVGSAGSYGRYKLFDEVTSCSATQIEVSYLESLSYTPLDNLKIENVSCETNIIVNSSNYITQDKNASQRFLKMGIDLENMEFYSVMYIANKFGINAKGKFVVTNYCDENAHRDFIKNQKKANELMEKIVKDLGFRF